MASGGARARSGPAPDPNALRRDRKDDAGWTTLPASGRKGPAPEFPLPGATERELEIWEREWKRPQAIMWERNGQEHEVALYVRTLVRAEDPEVSAALLTLVRQMQEALGLSIPGLHRNRWIIAEATGAQISAPVAGNVVPARDRFRKASNGVTPA